MAWAYRVMAVSLEMVLPGLVCLWIDRRLGIFPVLSLVGFVVGPVLGMWHLIAMLGTPKGKAGRTKREP